MSKQNNPKGSEGTPKTNPAGQAVKPGAEGQTPNHGGGGGGNKNHGGNGGGHGGHGHPGGSNVVTLPGACMAESCKKKSEKAGFCMEHFDWFKEGLITKEGRKPTDFDKKFFNYQKRRKPAA